MLSSVLRRTILRSGTLLSAQRLLPCTISPNLPLTWPVQKGFATNVEPESKRKSTGGKTRSNSKVARKDKTKEKTDGSTKAKAKQRIAIKSEDRPPKNPGSHYTVWMSDWIRTQPKVDSLPAAQNLVREGAQAWHNVSEDDKQKYREKFEDIKAEYLQRVQKWRETIKPAVLREMNRRRAEKGLSRIRGRPTGRPAPSFFRYFQEVRQDFLRTQETNNEYLKALGNKAASQWRAMSEDEKAKYRDAANAEFATWREKRKAEGHA